MVELSDWPLIAVLIITAAAAASIIWSTLRLGIGPMPSSRAAMVAMVSLLERQSKCIVELGAGWGGLTFALSREFPHAKVIAYEASLVPWFFLLVRRRASGAPNVEIRHSDFFNQSLAEADGVVCYLFTGAMRRLDQKLRTELKAGTVIVSNTFSLAGWKPAEVRELNDLYRTKVFKYVVGEER